MSNQHQEFPELTREAQAAYNAAVNAAQQSDIISSTFDLRRALAAFLREAMNQYRLGYGTPLWNKLEAIAASLHTPQPPPPTLAEAREADLRTPEGQATARAFLATLGEGRA